MCGRLAGHHHGSGPQSGPETETKPVTAQVTRRNGRIYKQVFYLRSGQPLVSGLVLKLHPALALGFSFLLPELGVVGQDSGVSLQDVVEHVEAVRAQNLGMVLHRAHLRIKQVLVRTHEGQELQLQGADLFSFSFRIRGPVQIFPAAF